MIRISLFLFPLLLGVASTATAEVALRHVGTWASGIFDDGACEIVDYDPALQRLYVTNSSKKNIEVLDLSDPTKPTLIKSLGFGDYGAEANAVAVNHARKLVAAAVENENKQEDGRIVLWNTEGEIQIAYPTGPLPDHIAISPDGRYFVTANEGEPADDYSVDPEGSLTVVDLGEDGSEPTHAELFQIGFAGLPAAMIEPGVRIFGPEASTARDLEPEFVCIGPDSRKAYCVCQENNALVIVDLASRKIEAVRALGFKDHSKPGNGFDASDKSDGIAIEPRPTFGMYQPDCIVAAEIGGVTWLFTANEGDARDYEGFSEETRVEDLKLDPEKFPNADELQKPENLGRLKTTTSLGDDDLDGDHDRIFSYGARSFSVWNDAGDLIYDSGDILERTIAEREPDDFNSTNDENGSRKNRSDDKGPEPECLAIGHLRGTPHLFVGMERHGGVMVFDVSEPARPAFAGYYNHRDFSADAKTPEAGDLGPEALVFIPEKSSPNGKDLLVVSSEVSGTVSVFEVSKE